MNAAAVAQQISVHCYGITTPSKSQKTCLILIATVDGHTWDLPRVFVWTWNCNPCKYVWQERPINTYNIFKLQEGLTYGG
jgi:hypothetical protein